jgi:hypothetical protein
MTDVQEAERRRDTGMKRSTDHANRERPNWSLQAAHALYAYCQEHKGEQFLCESVRAWSEAKMLVSEPPTSKAWGSIFKEAAKAGTVCKVGYAPSKSSNLSPKTLWEAV